MFETINTTRNRSKLLIILNILIYTNYLIFMLTFLIFSVLEIWNKQKKHKVENYLIRAIPINYYFFNFFNTFSNNPKSSIFWDMQNFLHYIKCNSNKVKYNYRFLDEVLVCPETIGYGPLTEYLNLGNLNIWNTTLISAIIFYTFYIFHIFIRR